MRRAIFGIALGAILMALGPASGSAAEGAAGNHEKYEWIVGATTPYAQATAHDGSWVRLKGHGLMQAGPGNFANGGGTFWVKKADGTLVTGSFMATDILGFVSYGAASAPLPPTFTGGEAKLRVTLVGYGSGVLTVVCVVPGSNPPEPRMEGIMLVLGQGGEFLDETKGNTRFIDVS